MSDLSFEVVGARAEPHAAVPTLVLRLRITDGSGAGVHALALRCQVRIEPQRRHYDAGEESRLVELFGDTPQWGDSLRPFLWTHVSTVVPGFSGSVDVDLPIECSYDLEVAAAKYLHALGDGDVPLLALFSGTVFRAGERGFAAVPVGWDQEASFRLPVATWRSVMDLYFPHSGWLRLDRATLDGLARFKATARPRPPGTRRSSGCSSWRARTADARDPGAGRPLRPGAGRGRRRAVRGLRAVPVPGLGPEEPGALAVRGARPPGLLRARGVGALGGTDRVPGRPRRRPDRHRAHPLPAGPAPGGRGRSRGRRRHRRRVPPVRRPHGRRHPPPALGRGRRAGRRPAGRAAAAGRRRSPPCLHLPGRRGGRGPPPRGRDGRRAAGAAAGGGAGRRAGAPPSGPTAPTRS